VTFNILDLPGMAVALAMIAGDVILHIAGHPVTQFDDVIPVIAAVYIAGRAGVHAGASAAAVGGAK
jgi:hypothetical protein